MEALEVGVIPPIPSFPLPNKALHLYSTFNGDAVVYGTESGAVMRFLPGCFDPTSKLTETFSGTKRPIVIAAVSPDGNLIVGGDDNGEIYIWNLRKKRLAAETGVFSPSGSPSGSVELRTLKLNMPYVRLADIVFSPDSKKIVICGADRYSKKLATCVFTDGGNACGKIEGHTLGVFAVSFQSIKPHYIASAGADGHLWIHQGPPYKTYKEIGAEMYAGQAIFCTRFSPDGKKLAACGKNGNLAIWDALHDFAVLHTLQSIIPPSNVVAPTPIYALAWNSESTRFVAIDDERHLSIVNADSAEILQVIRTSPTEKGVGVTWTAKDWVVTVCDQGRLCGFRTENQSMFLPKERFIWRGVRGICTCVSVNTLTGKLVVGDSLGFVLFLSTSDAEPTVFNGLKLPTNVTVRCASTGEYSAAVCTNDGTIRVFKLPEVVSVAQQTTSLAEGKSSSDLCTTGDIENCETRIIELPNDSELPVPLIGEHSFKEVPISCVSVLNEAAVVVFCINGSVCAYPLNGQSDCIEPADLCAQFNMLWTFKIEGTITGASASVDGTLVAIALTPNSAYSPEKFGDDRTEISRNAALIELYEVDDLTDEGFRFVCVYEFPDTEISAIAVSPEGTHVAYANNRREIAVFETETGDHVIKSEWRYHSTKINSLDWSPDGTKVLSGSQDRDCWVCDLEYSGRYIRISDAHPGGTSCVQFILNNVVLSTGNDGVVAIHETTFPPPPPGAIPYKLHEDTGDALTDEGPENSGDDEN